MRGFQRAAALVLILAAADVAWAGWEIEQTTYNLRASGEEISRHNSTLHVSKDRVRMADPKITTIVEYKADRLVMMMPSKKIYWDGTSDEYLEAARRLNPKNRLTEKQRQRMPNLALRITELPDKIEIAGKVATKYAIQLDGYPFQDVWVTEAFGVEKDLDYESFQAMQLKLAQSVKSGYGAALGAMQKNPEYQKIHRTGFPMRINSYMGEAIMGTQVLRVVAKELPESDFQVPKDFKRVPLVQFMDEKDPRIVATTPAAKKGAATPVAKPKKK